MYIEKNKTSSDSFRQSKCHMFSFRSTKPRLEHVCICGMCMCVCVDVICHGRMIRNSAQTTILSRSLSNLQYSHRVYLDMCKYIDVCIYLNIYVHSHICVCIRMNIWEYTCIHIFRYIRMNIWEYTYVYILCSHVPFPPFPTLFPFSSFSPFSFSVVLNLTFRQSLQLLLGASAKIVEKSRT